MLSTMPNKSEVCSLKNNKNSNFYIDDSNSIEYTNQSSLDRFLKSIILYLISSVFILLKIFHMLYQSVLSFFFLLGCSLKKICSCKSKQKLKRCESGFLDQSNNSNKLTVVIDLDNTLIASSTLKIEKAKNYTVMDNKFFVYKRPYLDNFLLSLSQHCELVIYTAGLKEYAEKIIDHIDKNHLIKTRYYRHDCLNVGNYWFKDASKCGIDERRVLIIDDSPKCHLTYTSKLLIIF